MHKNNGFAIGNIWKINKLSINLARKAFKMITKSRKFQINIKKQIKIKKNKSFGI